MNKYFIQTYGCQMNVADSNFMEDCLFRRGLKPAGDIKEADIIVINTCSVRDHAEHRALSFVGRLKPLKKRNPVLKIVFAGCAAERLGKNMKSRFQMVDEVFGAKSIVSFPQIIDKLINTDVSNPSPLLTRSLAHSLTRPVSAFVTIMRGCENYCSYCVVPYVRGKEISRPAAEIIKEIECLAARGVKEVTLLGQNVNSYKDTGHVNKDTGHGSRVTGHDKIIDFPELLKMVNGIKDIERIRFMTSHPKDSGEKLIDAMAGLDKVCEHLHLPLQSGSITTLKAMNRGYTPADYLKIVRDFRKKAPGGSITTDVLVGFPGETKADFKKTLALVKKIGFDFLFAFKYSSRPGTSSAQLKDSVPRTEKEARHAELLKTASAMSMEKNATLIGALAEVLVEKCGDGICSGLTRTNKKVYFPSKENLAGKTVKVRIISNKINSFAGTEA